MARIEQKFNGHSFVNKKKFNLTEDVFAIGNLDAEKDKEKKILEEKNKNEAVFNASNNKITTDKTVKNDSIIIDESSLGSKDENTSMEKIAELTKITEEFINSAREGFNYSLATEINKNIYEFKTSESGRDSDGQIDSKTADTAERIDSMIKGSMFQPAYFSGSKVDFVEKMDFLAKLTKPKKASEGSGFSFTTPPVAHIKLGDWWDHDIVVNTVTVDYNDSPWSLDSSVQPLWAKVTLGFNFIGPYGGEGKPVLADEDGGIYSRRK